MCRTPGCPELFHLHNSLSVIAGPADAFRLRDTVRRMSQENVEVAKRAADAYNRGDIETFFAEFVTPDLEWWPALTRAYEGDCYKGRAGIERFFAESAETWEEFRAVSEEFRDLGDRVLVLGRVQGRGKGSGAEVDAPMANILDFRDGRIWRSRVYFDRAEGLRVAGVPE
jgi:ketosteroid isomerase-like protein